MILYKLCHQIAPYSRNLSCKIPVPSPADAPICKSSFGSASVYTPAVNVYNSARYRTGNKVFFSWKWRIERNNTYASEIGQRMRNGEKKDGKRINHGFLSVLQRWQIYPNIALLRGVIVGFRQAWISTKKRSGTVNRNDIFHLSIIAIQIT